MPDPGTVAVLIPIVALLIPIVAILTRHQQKMAELIHGGQKDNQQIGLLLHEIQQLKQLVHEQTVQIDDMKALGSGAPPKN